MGSVDAPALIGFLAAAERQGASAAVAHRLLGILLLEHFGLPVDLGKNTRTAYRSLVRYLARDSDARSLIDALRAAEGHQGPPGRGSVAS